MKITALIFFLLMTTLLFGQAKRSNMFFGAGIDYRQYPIDIEDAPPGPLPHDEGPPLDDLKIWQVFSIHGRSGLQLKKNWFVSISLYTRYNLLHRIQAINIANPYPENVKVKKNFKYDLFLDVEKKFLLKRNEERYFFVMAGLGITNLNSRFDITLTDSTEYGPFPPHHYSGTLLHFSPRLSIGYQYGKMKISLDSYIIEDPALTNLTSLWLGTTISYESLLKRKKKK